LGVANEKVLGRDAEAEADTSAGAIEEGVDRPNPPNADATPGGAG
jgi:hypothetical protein